ncbi:MAG TPA: hypothetical protein VGP25_17870 [Gemmatimonadaceae bacterium]|nr:hypothetical protein [Gemmatimonadaceae bacterium]
MGAALESAFTFLFKYPPRFFGRGDLVFAPVVPVWLVALAALAALALIVVAYRRLRGISHIDRLVLGAIRALALLLLLGCLLRPTEVLSSAVPQRNVLAILLDDSRSMRLGDVGGGSRTLAMQHAFADTSSLVRRLSSRYAVRTFRFAADATPTPPGTALTASGGRTDLAAALDGVRTDLAGMPVAGVIVVSDGADNSGGDIEASLLALKARKVPVYTVGVGQERFSRDVAVASVTAPPSVLAGSTVLIDAAIGVRGVAGEKTTLTAEADGRIVATQELTIPSNVDVVRAQLRVPPMPAGSYRLAVRARPVRGEQVAENNVFNTVLDVRRGPARVLYVEGEPRPEFAFLRRAVATDSALQVVGLMRSAEHKFLRLGVRDSLELVNGFPTRREELFQFRAIVLGSIESAFFTGDQLRMLADFVGQRGGSLLALGGRSALAEGGYTGTPVAEVLPVTLNQTRADTGAAPVELALRPTTAGRIHAALRLRDSDAANSARWDSLPPLTSVNHLGTLRPGATTLLSGRPTAARDAADQPLLAFQRYGRGMGIVFGVQDSWLWRMHASMPISDATHATLWRQMLRWMVEGVPDQVEIAAVPARVTPGEPVELRARVVDSTFTPLAQATVAARVTTPTGAVVDVPLERSPRGDGTYTGRYVPADRGAYTISAAARAGSDSLHSVDGALLADDQGADVEQAELRTALLRQLSNETGGRYYPLAQSAQLADDVNYTESGVTQKDAHDLWDMPIVFLLLVTLLGAEWFYRRRRGLA